MGANWQFGNVVVGGELDASWSSLKGNAAFDPTFLPSAPFGIKIKAMATGTGRVGYAWGNWLGYGKLGVAWADIDFIFAQSAPPPQGSIVVPHYRTGITGGGGVEVAFWGNLSARLEYNVVYFGPQSLSSSRFPMGPPNLDHVIQIVKGGLNVRFGGDYLVARY
jgi:outer membrane immunogenic protein